MVYHYPSHEDDPCPQGWMKRTETAIALLAPMWHHQVLDVSIEPNSLPQANPHVLSNVCLVLNVALK